MIVRMICFDSPVILQACSYRLSLADILQSLDINYFLTQLALTAWLGVIFNAGELGCVLEELRQRLRSQLLVFIRVHVLVSIHIRVVGIGLAALRC